MVGREKARLNLGALCSVASVVLHGGAARNISYIGLQAQEGSRHK